MAELSQDQIKAEMTRYDAWVKAALKPAPEDPSSKPGFGDLPFPAQQPQLNAYERDMGQYHANPMLGIVEGLKLKYEKYGHGGFDKEKLEFKDKGIQAAFLQELK